MGRIETKMKKNYNKMKEFYRGHRLSLKLFWAPFIVLVLWISGCGDGLREGVKILVAGFDEIKAEGIVYVRASDGDDTNPGTRDLPKATIQNAIDVAADLLEVAEVHVAEGSYVVSFQEGNHVKMKMGVSLYGGYSSADWDVRDPNQYPAIIKDTSLSGEGGNRAVDCGDNLTSATVIDGFNIQGGSGPISVAINCRSSSPTIQNNVLNGGNGTHSIGIFLSDASPIIKGNTIDAGGGNTGDGILSNLSAPTIQNNIIRGGTKSFSSGIYNTRSEPLIIDNLIDGGSGSVVVGIHNTDSSIAIIRNNIIFGGTGTISPLTYGIIVENSQSSIQNNTIDGGFSEPLSGGKSYGIQIFFASPTIENNIIFTSDGNERYGIFELGSSSFPISLKNNDIYDCPDALYVQNTLTNITNISGVNFLIFANGNISQDPLFMDRDGPDNNKATMDDNDWHLTNSSPVKNVGINLSGIFTTDRDGITRTVPWSIGAYEKD
jgi:hypothetical protein